MASTYENSLRLELIATGEAASTWGDKTNDNLTAIAAAFGYATQDGFAADANATTTVADGAADPARALYFKITSSATLTATRTLTIAPNTISRVMWIENATTGSQSIAISQGSGANVTIPAGKTAVVYLDGAGAGASVVDAMASLNIDGSISAGAATFSGGITATGIDVTGTVTADGLILDNAQYISFKNSSNVSTRSLGINGANTFYIGGIDADIGDILFVSGGTTRASFANGGDISFYEDTGTSPKMVWSASAEDLQIGGNLLNLSGVSSGTTGARLNANGGGMLRLASGGVDALYVVDGGNVGLGVVPTVSSPYRSIQLGASIGVGILAARTDGVNAVNLGLNWDYDGGANLLYKESSFATNYRQIAGKHEWTTAASGIAGNAITFTPAMTLDASGNFIVGSTSAFDSSSFCVDQSGLGQFRRDGTPLIIRRDGSDGGLINFEKDGASVGSIGSVSGVVSYITLDPRSGGTGIGASNTDSIIPVTGTGVASDATKDLGLSNIRWRNLYLSSGVYLGGTGAANYLDDYEEGTFTGTLRASYTEPATLITTTGYFTKVGRIVQYSIGFEAANTTGYTGNLTITGLPFTNEGGRAIGNIVGYAGLTWSGTSCFSVIGVHATTLEAFTISSNSVWAAATHNAGSGRYFWLSGTYITTA